jgi:hypothetical protein
MRLGGVPSRVGEGAGAGEPTLTGGTATWLFAINTDKRFAKNRGRGVDNR